MAATGMPRCGHCGSYDVQGGLHQFQCLAFGCGLRTNYDGTPVPAPEVNAPAPEPDESWKYT